MTTAVIGYTYTVETRAVQFYFSHDTNEFQPEELIAGITRYAVYFDGTVSEKGEALESLEDVSFNGLTPELLYTADGYVYHVAAVIADEFGMQPIRAAGIVYIGVKGDANLDGTADAKDAAKLLEYAAAVGAGQDASLYSGIDERVESFTFFLAEVNAAGDADAKDAAAILEYAAAIGSGEPKSWKEILNAG